MNRIRRLSDPRVGRRAIGRAAHLRVTIVIAVVITARTECIDMWWDTTAGK